MSSKRVIGFVIVTFILAGVAVFALTPGLRSRQPNGTICPGTSATHVVTIQHDTMSPSHIDGKLCDTLQIKNLDNVSRAIAFGSHDHHVPYDGVTERVLGKNESFTITLNKTGTYPFHDHFHDEVAGTFIVTQ